MPGIRKGSVSEASDENARGPIGGRVRGYCSCTTHFQDAEGARAMKERRHSLWFMKGVRLWSWFREELVFVTSTQRLIHPAIKKCHDRRPHRLKRREEGENERWGGNKIENVFKSRSWRCSNFTVAQRRCLRAVEPARGAHTVHPWHSEEEPYIMRTRLLWRKSYRSCRYSIKARQS